jgi:hypothetical protein
LIFIRLQFAARHEETTPPPHVLHWSPLLSNAPPNVDADLYLIVVSPHQMAAIKGQGSAHLFIFFVAPFDSPHDKQPSSPHVPTQPRLLSNAPPKRRSRLLVGCCVPPSIGGQLGPRYPLNPHPLSLSFDPSFQIPPNEQTPTARGLCMVMGSGVDMIWWRLCSTHEERRAKPLEGRVGTALLVVGCCV